MKFLDEVLHCIQGNVFNYNPPLQMRVHSGVSVWTSYSKCRVQCQFLVVAHTASGRVEQQVDGSNRE